MTTEYTVVARATDASTVTMWPDTTTVVGTGTAGPQGPAGDGAADLTAHNADTTNVHGIVDTSALYRAGGTDVAVADGGTGASDAAAARTNLGLGTAATTAATDYATAAQGTKADTAVQPARTISTTAPLTGGGDLSANRTLGVSAASDTASGVVELATSAETVTGTDTARAVTPASAAAAFVAKSLVDAKGDLIVATANDTVARLAVGGTDGHVLTVDAASAAGVKWAAASGGGGGLPVQPLVGDSTYSGTPGVHIYNPALTSWASVVADRAVWGFFVVTSTLTISSAEVRVTVAGAAGAKVRLGVYECTAALQPGDLVADFGEVAADSLGRKQITGLSSTLSPGFYFAVAVASVSLSLELHGGYCPWWSHHPVAFSNPLSGYTGTIFTFGPLPASVSAIGSGNFRNAGDGIIVPITFRWS